MHCTASALALHPDLVGIGLLHYILVFTDALKGVLQDGKTLTRPSNLEETMEFNLNLASCFAMKQRGTRKGRVLKFTFDELAYTSAEGVEDPESGEMARVCISAAKFDAGTLKTLDAWDNNKATIDREVSCGEKPKVHKINVAESLELVLLAIESTSLGKNLSSSS